MEKGILREKYRGAVRRVFLAVFFFAAMFLLSACGNAGSGVPEDSSDMAEAEEPGLAVLLVTDSKIAEDSIEDRTRNGIENFLKKHPSCTLEEIVETDARKAVPRASGYDAAVFVGASFSGIGKQPESRETAALSSSIRRSRMRRGRSSRSRMSVQSLFVRRKRDFWQGSAQRSPRKRTVSLRTSTVKIRTVRSFWDLPTVSTMQPAHMAQRIQGLRSGM